MPFVLGEVAEVELSSSVLLLPTNPARHHHSLGGAIDEQLPSY